MKVLINYIMVTYLNLSDKKLTEFPDNLSNSLIELTLYNNQITKIPDNLPNTLTHLDLDEIKLQKFQKIYQIL